jgi:hypothetical protein
MNGVLVFGRGPDRKSRLLVAALAAALAAPLAARAAPGDAPAAKDAEPGAVVPAGCSSCGGGLLGLPPPEAGIAPEGGCNSCCYPGRRPCDCCVNSDNCCGRFFGGLYQCICCPDPCYEPHYVPLADSAFFVDPARPMTQMRFRGDFGWDLEFPDRAEFFTARLDGHGKGPDSTIAPFSPTNRLDYHTGYLYTEAAIERFGAFVEMAYENIEPDNFGTASGFGDMNVGTKTLLLDCELIQFTFQFRVYIPTGNFNRGIGTGHASLEPSFIAAIKLSPTTYLQAQTAYWFAVGGDQAFEGNVFHYQLSLNHLIWNCGHDVQLIATFEAGGYEFNSGAATDPVTGLAITARSIGSIFNVGPGIRLHLCDKIDFGVGTQFAITDDHLAEELVRAEFRIRF